MDKLKPHFSFAGRTNRQPYWVTSVLIYMAIVVASFTAVTLPIIGLLVFIPVLVLGLWAGMAVAVRRLHDRNKSGWWLLAMYLPPTLFSIVGELASVSNPEAGSGVALLGVPFSIWAFVELGCLKGTIGPNRFGDDPLQPTVAEVFS
jgi:uncharacterized membrane protein YhaH (DUF805 family)